MFTFKTISIVIAAGFLLVAPFSDASVVYVKRASQNWGGYVADRGGYTGVSGTWLVPTSRFSGIEEMAAEATWIGVGGSRSLDLIQAGTQTIIQKGQVSYHMWYETLPGPAYNIPLEVRAGDLVTISMKEISTNKWEISFTNETSGRTYLQDINYVSSHSSVEWMEERPSSYSNQNLIQLANFGSALFFNGAATMNGAQVNIAEAGGEPVTMATQGGVLLASPSSLVNGHAFSITRSINQVSASLPTSNLTVISGL